MAESRTSPSKSPSATALTSVTTSAFGRPLKQVRDGAPLWLGSASFDKGVGLSHDTGQITHHIGPDVDAERDNLIADLEKAGWLQSRPM